MQVVAKGHLQSHLTWKQQIRCSNEYCCADLEITHEDVRYYFEPEHHGGSSGYHYPAVSKFFVICPECSGEVIMPDDLSIHVKREAVRRWNERLEAERQRRKEEWRIWRKKWLRF